MRSHIILNPRSEADRTVFDRQYDTQMRHVIRRQIKQHRKCKPGERLDGELFFLALHYGLHEEVKGL